MESSGIWSKGKHHKLRRNLIGSTTYTVESDWWDVGTLQTNRGGYVISGYVISLGKNVHCRPADLRD